MKISTIALSLGLINLLSTTLIAHAQTQNNSVSCKAQSGALVSPVIELYTSESCSSCPPADKWVSSLKNKNLIKENDQVKKYLKKKTKAIALFVFKGV